MSSALKHFSHHKHPLILQEDAEDTDTNVGPKCHICDESILNSPAYTCQSHEDFSCQSFYIHKTCAELPTRINHHKHSQHRLTLLPRPDKYYCDVCSRLVKIAYTCDDCDFDVCVVCTSDQRILHHAGHEDHDLILMNRKASVECDACGRVARDSTYVCTMCEFWIHKKCAFADTIIPSTHHHHPLYLVYSFPYMHTDIKRHCKICHKICYNSNWMYYCHECTYFVHMNCATSTEPDETESDSEDELDKLEDGIDKLSELVQSPPVDSEESPIDLISSFVSDLGLF